MSGLITIKKLRAIGLPFIISFCAVVTLFSCSGNGERQKKHKASEPASVAGSEADSFLAGMPEKLQDRQTEAIRMAIAGKPDSLIKVRNARNTVAELPSDIRRTDLGNGMALFRSKRHDNDTIPLLVYFHGGGWVIGSINSCSRYCGAIAAKGISVLAVDYRLAPEHPFPEGLTDCIDAVRFAQSNLKKWKCEGISVGGDSSGGNLAIATALSFPSDTFRSLIVFYPVTKAYADNSDSWKKYGKGFGLDSELMETFNAAYTSGPHDPLVSPAEAADTTLSKLPPTLLVAADRDILKDQGHDFAKHLSRIGVKCKYLLIPGSVHLFITVPGQPYAFGRAVKESAEFILSR